ncbi:DUF3427 domain-containing protein [Brevibacterium sp. HMSC063G07]|uniref:DUF3427 domain-containing protein n=1 Tax=Brevibacterium sp. HMSC063G07 TaxID=1739261 RepID=UPI0008A1E153|nr:DEAD/DEAH box helicase [Brevibacterium sp. HMSC063G07]OFL67905.1 helicase [Brevibacterium sp. HMSC063G07]
MNVPELQPGLYESLVTTGLERVLQEHEDELRNAVHNIDEADLPHVLSRYVAQHVEQELKALKTTEQRVEFVNAILASIRSLPQDGQLSTNHKPRQLRGVARPPHALPNPPSTPLSDVALLTNAKGDPQLGPEIRLEMQSADRVDVIMSFIKWSGIRVLEDQLLDLRRRGVPVRVLTTTYMGATEKKALDFLVNKCGAEVHISYDNKTTRLHAKAWVFHRKTGYDTAYIGSSNLSHAAMVDGLEWNVRASRVQTPELVEKFETTFESYWQSPMFEPYGPEADGERLEKALNESSTNKTPVSLLASSLDVRPYPHQAIILDDLQHERQVLGIHKNLVVAATGTGKTVVAALDYRRQCEDTDGPRPRLLFIAHRQEILEQSLRTFRDVLGDGSFGELFCSGYLPTTWDHVFASIQSFSKEEQLSRFDPGHFDVIIIDEFHHGSAVSYSRLISHFTEYREFLGLTATPERADGQNIVAHYFGGRIASELRLWTALDNDLLVPFHYFGVADGVDVSRVQFTAGGYSVAGLNKVYTGNDARARKIIAATNDIVSDPSTMKALGFCVSVEHAEYMARVFNEAGIPSEAVTGHTDPTIRAEAIDKLAHGELNCLMAVDVFNEGFDLPAIDTILMMRPTQSATIFIQQLGRGLRRTQGKSVLTVLDFVGHQHKDFRFDIKLRALTGQGRKSLQHSAKEGFPFLPAGSQIVLDSVVREEVVNNLKSQLDMKIGAFLVDVHEHSSEIERQQGLRLKEYLDRTDRGLSTVYKASAKRTYKGVSGPNSWRQYEAWANTRRSFNPSVAEQLLLERMRSFVHVDDPDRFRGYRRILNADAVTPELARDPLAIMLYYSFWPSGHSEGIEVGLERLLRADYVRDELDQIIEFQESRSRVVPQPLSGGLETQPVRSHATYSREELLAGLGVGSINSEKPGSIREGVKWVPELKTDILLVTLNKSAADYSPSTMYRDYALTETLFHWESQSLTRAESATGQRYINHERDGSNVVLFVRESKVGEIGTEPYTCLGNARYVSHEGEKPMQIVWELERPMPARLYEIAKAVQ